MILGFGSQAAHIVRMKAVDVFIGANQIDYFILVKMGRQRKLHKNSVYLRVLSQLRHFRTQLFFADISR